VNENLAFFLGIACYKNYALIRLIEAKVSILAIEPKLKLGPFQAIMAEFEQLASIMRNRSIRQAFRIFKAIEYHETQ